MVTIALRASFSPESRLSVSRRSTRFRSAVNLAPQVGFNVLAFAAQIEIGGDIVAPAHQFCLGGEHILQALFLAHDLLGFLRIRPKIGVSSLLVNFG